ncbi:MAG: DUF2062 domain-containing protein [Candidatus Omnitrophota bacterium]
MKNKENRIKRFLKLLYSQLFRINDSAQKVALGFGVGVASGILPGTGPLVALFLAFIFRINRAAALIGCLLTNTWLSFLTFLLAIKLGSGILGTDWQKVIHDWESFLKEFRWVNLFKLSVLKIALPVLTGYFVISVSLGLLAYIITLAAIQLKLKRKKAL